MVVCDLTVLGFHDSFRRGQSCNGPVILNIFAGQAGFRQPFHRSQLSPAIEHDNAQTRGADTNQYPPKTHRLFSCFLAQPEYRAQIRPPSW